MESLNTFYYRYLRYYLSKDGTTATPYDRYLSLSYAVRNRLVDNWIETQKLYHESNARRVYFFSMEYVLGRSLKNNIINLGLEEEVERAAVSLGFSLDDIFEQEDSLDLGNSAEATLAAYLQSALAARGIPAMGYGLYYDYGHFAQQIRNSTQIEHPRDLLHKGGDPWEIARPEYSCRIPFHGSVSTLEPGKPGEKFTWNFSEEVIGLPYDIPIPGYDNSTVNTLRLWSAYASDEFLSDYVNHGDYVRACIEKSQSGSITKVLFPEEDVRKTTELRIKQHYFLISASLQDIIRRYKQHNSNIRDIEKKIVIHLNGSRCALAPIEFIRLMVDEEGIPWTDAVDMTRKIFTCTCQAISRDNLENWPIYLVQELLPRHLQIIFEINQQHLDSIRKFGNKDLEVLRELSLVEEGEVKRIRMSHLALICTSKFNGVSIAQTQALKDKVFYPAVENNVCAFSTVTDGIDLRRWMLGANRALPTLITDAIGPKWMKSPQELIKLIDYCDDSEFLFRIEEAKYAAKKRFAYFYQQKCGISVEPGFFFDVQACRIHPSRRQALHILSILDRYLKIKKGEDFGFPRLHIFAGKASPSDHLAKQNILLINIVADLINADSAVADKLRVAFVPDYGMSWAEYLVPAADLAEYLTTPGLQASSSSILPFAVNGAAVIHSKAGLYTELSQRMGPGNIITFGKTLAELQALKGYSAWDERSKNERLRAIFEFLEQNLSSIPNGTGLYPLLSTLSDSDQNFVLLDFDEYIAQQEAIDGYFLDKTGWVGRGIKNIANSGWFSCDNTVESYVKDIWNIEAIK